MEGDVRIRLLESDDSFDALTELLHASHLIRFYDRRGYRHIGHAQWAHANYRSVLLSKSLSTR